MLKPPGYSHKLQVLEGGEVPRNQGELVSVQVAAGENTAVSAPSPPLAVLVLGGPCPAARAFSLVPL